MSQTIKSDDDVIALTPKAKEYLVGVQEFKNLFVRVRPNGSKNYQVYYTKNGKQEKLLLPSVKKITLAFAKGYAVACQVALKNEQDPRLLKEQGRLSVNPLPFMQTRQYQDFNDTTLRTFIGEWFAWKFQSDHLYAESTLGRWKSAFDPVLSEFGATPIANITTAELFDFFTQLNRQSKNKATTALSYLYSVYTYANVRGLVEKNPCVGIKKMLHTKKPKNQPAITDHDGFSRLINDIYAFEDCFLTTSYALKLLPYLFVRVGDFCNMRWQDIDFDKKEWVFIPQKQPQYKSAKPETFIVPLCEQACALLYEIQALDVGGVYVFSSVYDVESPCIDNSTLNKALYRMGYHQRHSVHGFRASAKTLLMEKLKFSHELTEIQLDHSLPKSHNGAYDRVQHLDDRKAMMTAWGNYLTEILNTLPPSNTP